MYYYSATVVPVTEKYMLIQYVTFATVCLLMVHNTLYLDSHNFFITELGDILVNIWSDLNFAVQSKH